MWNHHGKCIQISTNMPGIGSVNREIDVNISEMSESKHDFCSVKTNAAVLTVKMIALYFIINTDVTN